MRNMSLDCGSIKQDTIAVITFQPSPSPESNSAGKIVSIEFVPKDFSFAEHKETQKTQ